MQLHTNTIDLDQADTLPAKNTFTDSHDFRGAEPEDEQVIREYIQLKDNLAQIEARLEWLKPQLMDLVLSQPDERKGRAFGYEFAVSYRKTYSYSEHVDEISAQLKSVKKYEEAHGIATLTKHQAVLSMKAIK